TFPSRSRRSGQESTGSRSQARSTTTPTQARSPPLPLPRSPSVNAVFLESTGNTFNALAELLVAVALREPAAGAEPSAALPSASPSSRDSTAVERLARTSAAGPKVEQAEALAESKERSAPGAGSRARGAPFATCCRGSAPSRRRAAADTRCRLYRRKCLSVAARAGPAAWEERKARPAADEPQGRLAAGVPAG